MFLLEGLFPLFLLVPLSVFFVTLRMYFLSGTHVTSGGLPSILVLLPASRLVVTTNIFIFSIRCDADPLHGYPSI